MNIILAPDKFKGSLSSFEVCTSIEKGLQQASDSFNITKLPMADGGDGLSEVIAHYVKLKKRKLTVADPLFRNIETSWMISENGQTAFVEMAKASGLDLLNPAEYNPLLTTTYGTGQMLQAAIDSSVKEIIVGIGGSATNDGGIGMAAALGYKLLDKNGKELEPIGANLIHIHQIDKSHVMNLSGINFKVACDVANVLCGENGASRVYGPQKGAGPQMVEELEKGLEHFSEIVKKDLGVDISTLQGGGAAGGMGAGCVAFLHAQLISGIELVMLYGRVEEYISEADIIITGEGKVDAQTLQGKVVSGISRLGKKYGKPVLVVCGTKNISADELTTLGAVAAFSIANGPTSLEESIKNAAGLLSDLAFQLGSVLLIGSKSCKQ